MTWAQEWRSRSRSVIWARWSKVLRSFMARTGKAGGKGIFKGKPGFPCGLLGGLSRSICLVASAESNVATRRGESLWFRDTRAEARAYGRMPLARQEDGIPAATTAGGRKSLPRQRLSTVARRFIAGIGDEEGCSSRVATIDLFGRSAGIKRRSAMRGIFMVP